MIQQLIDQHLSAITAQIREKYPSEMESYAKQAYRIRNGCGSGRRGYADRFKNLGHEKRVGFRLKNSLYFKSVPDYEQFGKQTIEFKITLEGTKSWRKVRRRQFSV